MKSNFNVVSDSTTQKEFNTSALCFENGNVILPFEIAKNSNYSIGEIAEILNIDCQEVCRQFNQMAKESNYCLFN